MGFIHFMVNFAWEILLICVAFALFGYITKNGFGTIREIASTIATMIRTFGHWIRKRCLDYLKKEESAESQPKDKQAAITAYNEYLQKRRAECMSFEEFYEKLKNGDPLTLD